MLNIHNEPHPMTPEQVEVAKSAITNALVFGTSIIRATEEQLEMNDLPRLTEHQRLGELVELAQAQEMFIGEER
jgi:tryptophan synthase alpha subunit|tara:strand:- start:666 stop:887 length:222 start_codon:yes stop_codon:yes gene_type:complete